MRNPSSLIFVRENLIQVNPIVDDDGCPDTCLLKIIMRIANDSSIWDGLFSLQQRTVMSRIFQDILAYTQEDIVTHSNLQGIVDARTNLGTMSMDDVRKLFMEYKSTISSDSLRMIYEALQALVQNNEKLGPFQAFFDIIAKPVEVQASKASNSLEALIVRYPAEGPRSVTKVGGKMLTVDPRSFTVDLEAVAQIMNAKGTVQDAVDQSLEELHGRRVPNDDDGDIKEIEELLRDSVKDSMNLCTMTSESKVTYTTYTMTWLYFITKILPKVMKPVEESQRGVADIPLPQIFEFLGSFMTLTLSLVQGDMAIIRDGCNRLNNVLAMIANFKNLYLWITDEVKRKVPLLELQKKLGQPINVLVMQGPPEEITGRIENAKLHRQSFESTRKHYSAVFNFFVALGGESTSFLAKPPSHQQSFQAAYDRTRMDALAEQVFKDATQFLKSCECTDFMNEKQYSDTEVLQWLESWMITMGWKQNSLPTPIDKIEWARLHLGLLLFNVANEPGYSFDTFKNNKEAMEEFFEGARPKKVVMMRLRMLVTILPAMPSEKFSVREKTACGPAVVVVLSEANTGKTAWKTSAELLQRYMKLSGWLKPKKSKEQPNRHINFSLLVQAMENGFPYPNPEQIHQVGKEFAAAAVAPAPAPAPEDERPKKVPHTEP
jgi:hypothetical protein